MIWRTFGGESGAVASTPIDATPNSIVHPSDVKTSQRWSVMPVKPGGSFGHGPVPGGATLITPLPLCPSEVAVILAVPAATPLTRPVGSTTATDGLLLIQFTGSPINESPAESSGTPWNGHEPSIGTVAVSGRTATDATRRWESTRTLAVPARPHVLLLAVTEKVPTAVSAVKTPSGVIVPPLALQTTGPAT